MLRFAIAGAALLAFTLTSIAVVVRDADTVRGATQPVLIGEDAASGRGFFDPKVATVQVGDTVEWQWTGQIVHTVTSDTGLFDSGIRTNGSMFSFTFDAPGTYLYYCSLHGQPGGVGHSGSVVVLEAPTSTPTSTPTNTPEPTATPTPIPPQCLTLREKIALIVGIARAIGAESGDPGYDAGLDLDASGAIGFGDLKRALRIPLCPR